MKAVVVLANEPVWPIVNGGRERMAGMIEGLAQEFSLTLVTASPRQQPPEAPPPLDIDVRVLPPPASPLGRMARGWPHLTASLLDRNALAQLQHVIHEIRPCALVASHSYLAAASLPAETAVVVDFPNLESRRQASLAGQGGVRRALHAMEHLKALQWEPRVARAAALCLAVDDTDRAQLRSWGAREVLEIPNVAKPPTSTPTPSPRDGYVLFFGSGSYGPNADGLRWLLHQVWPLVQALDPGLRLVVAGRGTAKAAGNKPCHNTEFRGFVEDLGALLAGASVVVAPVQSGAGSQLKVVSALAHGRSIVATPFSARSVPRTHRDTVKLASTPDEFARAVVDTVQDADGRHRREEQLVRTPLPSWPQAVAPLVHWIRTC
jgi:hypothetical protein